MIAAGIDCGAGRTKAVVLNRGRLAGSAAVATGYDLARAAGEALARAAAAAAIGREAIAALGATGSGRAAAAPGALAVDEVRAVARGAFHLLPGARTVVEAGAEEGRAARLDERGRVLDAVSNERCAAGAGAFIEAMARALEVGIAEMGPLGLQARKSAPINAQCVVFAESEVVQLIHAGVARAEISRAIHQAVGGRLATMVRRLGVQPEVVFAGGLARNPAIVAALECELGIERLRIPAGPEFVAALGAALCAAEGAP
jgi:benzoyl-CoA reductase subunit D